MILRHSFTPLNNSRLAHLCGPLDEHLRAIERALDVKIAHRHEQFKVDGPKAKASRAMEVLQALYEQVLDEPQLNNKETLLALALQLQQTKQE